jgi:hypothetical protein
LIPPFILKQKFFLKTIGLSKEIEKSKIDQNQKLKVRINEFCKKETKKDAIPDNSLFCWSKSKSQILPETERSQPSNCLGLLIKQHFGCRPSGNKKI